MRYWTSSCSTPISGTCCGPPACVRWRTPHAFASHYEAEAKWADEQWRQRLVAATCLVAIESGAVIGIAGLLVLIFLHIVRRPAD